MTGNFTITVRQAPSRVIYLKTAGILLLVLLVIHVSGQWRTPPLIDGRLSLLICAGFFPLLLFGLSRAPFTRSLSLDFDRRVILIRYLTLARDENTLEIPFDQLTLKTDASFGVKSYGIKWRLHLFRDCRQVYSLSSDESGFTETEVDDFVKRLKECASQ